MMPLGLEPEQGPMRVEIADERLPAEAPPSPEPPEEPKTGLKSWWERFER
jgi:hypothetical protein